MDAPSTIGKYEVIQQIAVGGFGVIYKGWDPFIKRPVAIKMCATPDDEVRQRFEQHPFICGYGFTAADCIIGHNVIWARGYGLCQDEIFRSYLSKISKRPAFVKAFADARSFQKDPEEGSELLDRFTG